jgi:hypothetical protein
MYRFFISIALLMLVGACSQKSSAITSAEDGQRVDETLDWNAQLIDGLFTAGTTPISALRIAAIMNIAMFDAANAVTHRSRPFHFDLDAPPGTSRRAARIGAAYTVLSTIFPGQQAKWDDAKAASVAALSDDEDDDGTGQFTLNGLAWGTTVALDVLAWRATDGSRTATFPAARRRACGAPTRSPGGTRVHGPFVVTSLDQFSPGSPASPYHGCPTTTK